MSGRYAELPRLRVNRHSVAHVQTGDAVPEVAVLYLLGLGYFSRRLLDLLCFGGILHAKSQRRTRRPRSSRAASSTADREEEQLAAHPDLVQAHKTMWYTPWRAIVYADSNGLQI